MAEAPPVSEELVAMLRCLENHTPLQLADAALLEKLNQSISAGTLKNRGGQPLERALDGCLVRADGKLGYPVLDGIPKMLADEAIELEGS